MNFLVIEDDHTIAGHLAEALQQAGHTCKAVTDGESGLFYALMAKFDVVILDIKLPKIDGMAILKMVRDQHILTPVLLVSAMGELDDKLNGFRGGANDYITKPFMSAELIARAESLVRWREEKDELTSLQTGGLKLDLINRTVSCEERSVALQSKEFQLLECLMRHHGRVVSRTMLLEHVWNYDFDPQTNVIDVHVSRLRQKIHSITELSMIETVRGAGYRINTPIDELPVLAH